MIPVLRKVPNLVQELKLSLVVPVEMPLKLLKNIFHAKTTNMQMIALLLMVLMSCFR